MTATTPDWLAQHGGAVRPKVGVDSWAVFVGDEPQYVLTLVPVGGHFGCKVMQSINGRRLDQGSSHPSPEEALRGGLEDLRKALGW